MRGYAGLCGAMRGYAGLCGAMRCYAGLCGAMRGYAGLCGGYDCHFWLYVELKKCRVAQFCNWLTLGGEKIFQALGRCSACHCPNFASRPGPGPQKLTNMSIWHLIDTKELAGSGGNNKNLTQISLFYNLSLDVLSD